MIVKLLILLIFTSIAVLVSIQDIKTLTIPLIPIYLGLLCLLICDFFYNKRDVLFNLFSAFIYFFLFMLIRFLTHKGLGLGDIQYSLLCGYFSGFPFVFFTGMISSFCGILFYLFLFFKNKTIKNLKIPFGPFMSIGAFTMGFIRLFYYSI